MKKIILILSIAFSLFSCKGLGDDKIQKNKRLSLCYTQGCYLNHKIRYAKSYDGINWQIENIGTLNGRHIAMQKDRLGHVHVAFDVSGFLYYTNNKNKGLWSSPVNIDSAGASCSYVSLAIDNNLKAHVSYMTSSTSTKYTLKYATNKNSSNFDSIALETRNGVGLSYMAGLYSNIGVDNSGNVHIVHAVNSSGRGLHYCRGNIETAPSSWLRHSIETGDASHIVMKLKNNELHVAYKYNSDLKYAKGSGTMFSKQIIPGAQPNAAPYTDMVIDNSGTPHIIYLTDVTGTPGMPSMRYAYLKSVWTVEDVNYDYTDYPSITYNNEDNIVHVAYLKTNGNDEGIKYTKRESGIWSTPIEVEGLPQAASVYTNLY